MFKQGSLKVASRGWTLHQLRHSALTHLAEEGVNLPLLMAKSGHQNLRSLQRYARPSADHSHARRGSSQPVSGSGPAPRAAPRSPGTGRRG
jgi:integrase